MQSFLPFARSRNILVHITPKMKKTKILIWSPLFLTIIFFGPLDDTFAKDTKKTLAKDEKLVFLDLSKVKARPSARRTSLLIREIFRQAFLITARDELGYRTRDASLGESTSDTELSKGQTIFDVLVKVHPQKSLEIQIRKKEGEEFKLIEKHKLELTNLSPVDAVVTEAEKLSRTWFKDILIQAGYSPKPKPKSTSKLPAQKIKFVRPDQLTYLEQYKQLVELHKAIGEKGESPERLAKLAQSYILFGTLTENYWSLIPLATKARALVYVERLQGKTSDKKFALSYRAFVRTLVGLDFMADLDIKNAKASNGNTLSLPEWFPIIEAHCHSDYRKISDAERTPGNELLIRYLQLLTNSYSGTSIEKDEAADSVMELIPYSVRAFYSKPIRVGHQQSLKMIKSVNSQLIPVVQKKIIDNYPTEMLDGIDKKSLVKLIQNREELTQDLHFLAEEILEKEEPSMSLLGSSVKEITYLQAWDLISRYREVYSINADKLIGIFMISLSEHPLKAFLDSFYWSRETSKDAILALRKVDHRHLTPATFPIFERAREIITDHDPLNLVAKVYIKNCSPVIPDLAMLFDNVLPEKEKTEWIHRLQNVSPHSPKTIGSLIIYDWEQVVDQIPLIIDKYEENSQLVLHSIASVYFHQFQYTDAEQIYKRMIKRHPSAETYRSLINLYKVQQKPELELKALEASLPYSNRGLQRGRQHYSIAKYYLRTGDYKAALPHAEKAAKTYSGWGLTIEADCQEMLGNMSRSYTLREQSALRYKKPFQFHYWCRSRGQEPSEAIRKELKPFLDYYSHVPLPKGHLGPVDQLIAYMFEQTALYHYFEDEKDLALDLLSYTVDEGGKSAQSYTALHAALIADELEYPEIRDRYLKRAVALEMKRSKLELELILFIKRIMQNKNRSKIMPENIDWHLQQLADNSHQTNYLYFIGKALLQKKQDKLAISYLQRAASSPDQIRYNAHLAAFALHQRKIKLPPLRATVFDAQTSQIMKLLTDGNAFLYHKRNEEALSYFDHTLKLFPDSSHAFLARARYYQQQNQKDLAKKDLTAAVKNAPHVVYPLLERGEFFESIQNEHAALKDYERALEIDLESATVHRKLANILSTSPDSKVRNGAKALEHAKLVQRLTPELKVENHALMAAVYAELKQFDKAKEHNQKAIDGAETNQSRKELKQLQKLYEQQKPYRRGDSL